jgi:hypothetical protein
MALLKLGQSVWLKIATGPLLQGSIDDADERGVWLIISQTFWPTLVPSTAYPQGAQNLRCFVPYSSMAWLMIVS